MEMEWYYVFLICAVVAIVIGEVLIPKTPSLEDCTYVKSEEPITPELIITVNTDKENDTTWVYRLR